MASREEIQALRELARKRHRAATQKVSRLKAKGVDVASAKLDPRRDPASFKKLNSIQLRAHIARLDKFVSRETQFVQSAHATQPLSGSLWHQHQMLQAAVNRKRAQPYEDSIKGQFLASLNMTVEQFMGMKPTHPITDAPTSKAPHLPTIKKSVGIPNDKQLRKNIANLKAQLADDYSDKISKRDKKTALKMLKRIGVQDIIKDTKGMSLQKFSFLWNYTDFARAAAQDYFLASSDMHDDEAMAGFHDTFDTQIKYMRDIIRDVKATNL